MGGDTNLIDPRVAMPANPAAPGRDVSDALDGVIIPTWAGDVHLAKACCASIRQFMGDIPVTLLVDGAADTAALEKLHGVSRLTLADIAPPEHLPRLTGSSLAKLPLFWASPHERFLCIDADALVWGDLRVYADFERFDFIAAEKIAGDWLIQDESSLSRHAFDLGPVAEVDPAVRWKGERFAIMGVFMARRGVFEKHRLMELAAMKCWRCYEQGLLNYLMWQAERDGGPRIGGYPFQLFPSEESMPPADRFIPQDWRKPLAVHFLGKKPRLGRRYCMMDTYRRLFLTMCGQRHAQAFRILLEDVRVILGRHRRSLARRFR